jgi:hypothetical protein
VIKSLFIRSFTSDFSEGIYPNSRIAMMLLFSRFSVAAGEIFFASPAKSSSFVLKFAMFRLLILPGSPGYRSEQCHRREAVGIFRVCGAKTTYGCRQSSTLQTVMMMKLLHVVRNHSTHDRKVAEETLGKRISQLYNDLY